MNKNTDELSNYIKKLFSILDKVPDEADSTVIFVNFLRNFLRLKTKDPIPTIEVMTIIKHQKPTIFYNMRKLSKLDPILEVLTNISMDLEKAEERIEALLYK